MRRENGNFTAELPVVLWMLIVLLFFPLLNLVTTCLRSYFFYNATQMAALAASRAPTFDQSVPPEKSAKAEASQALLQFTSSFSGVKVTSFTTSILRIDSATGTVSRFTIPLVPPLNTNKYLYQIEVSGTAEVSPLLYHSAITFGAVPGLTAPMLLTTRAKENCESPEGLTL